MLLLQALAKLKVLCIADRVDTLVYATSIREKFGDVDIVVSAGDLPAEYLGFISSCLEKPLLFIFGNHNVSGFDLNAGSDAGFDPSKQEKQAGRQRPEYLGFRTKRRLGLFFVGLGGSKRHSRGENQFSEWAMIGKILLLLPSLCLNRLFHGSWLDILVTHAPPEGIHDRTDPSHRGFRCYRRFMDLFQPKVLIHGHVHSDNSDENPMSYYGTTMIVNASGHRLIQIEDATVE